jgi:hypothetical protein
MTDRQPVGPLDRILAPRQVEKMPFLHQKRNVPIWGRFGMSSTQIRALSFFPTAASPVLV